MKESGQTDPCSNCYPGCLSGNLFSVAERTGRDGHKRKKHIAEGSIQAGASGYRSGVKDYMRGTSLSYFCQQFPHHTLESFIYFSNIKCLLWIRCYTWAWDIKVKKTELLISLKWFQPSYPLGKQSYSRSPHPQSYRPLGPVNTHRSLWHLAAPALPPRQFTVGWGGAT